MPYHLLVISGPSGSGKGTLIRFLIDMLGSRVYYVRSVTTRPPRNDNNDHYLFVSEEEFSNMLSSNAFAECARYNNHCYGTPWSEIKPDCINLLDIDIHGLRQLKNSKLSPHIRSIYILPPSAQELYHRLQKRATESSEMILSRLRIALEELHSATDYDHILCHNTTADTACVVLQIIYGKEVEYPCSLDLEKFQCDLQNIISNF